MGVDLYVLGAIALLTLCSFLTRSGYFVLGDYLPLGDKLRRALRYAPGAALVGIVIPELLPWHGAVDSPFGFKALAALVGVLVFLRTRSSVLLIVAGMITLWLLRLLMLLAPGVGI